MQLYAIRFCGPLKSFSHAHDFLMHELTSDRVVERLAQQQRTNHWIEFDSVYFELVGDVSHLFEDILLICSKVYSNGLICNIIYFEGTIYLTIEEVQNEQPLIDINFPDISVEDKGAVLASYENQNLPWIKLSIYQVKAPASYMCSNTQPGSDDQMIKDISGVFFIQSYCILSSENNSDERDILFRFGSWCYSGRVALSPTLELQDLPRLIPLLRLQQSKLQFSSDISEIASPYSFAMKYAYTVAVEMETEVLSSEYFLDNHIKRELLEDISGKHWLEKDGSTCLFEFSCINPSILDMVDMMVTNTYRPNGLVSTVIYHKGSFFLILNDNTQMYRPLQDCILPDLSMRDKCCVVQSYPSGTSKWPELRKLSIWRVVQNEDVEEVQELTKSCDGVGSANMKNCLNELDIEDFSSCLAASSDEDEPFTNAVTSAIDILDDAMLDLCDTFDAAMADIVDGNNTCSNLDRATKLISLEKKLSEINDRVKGKKAETNI